MFDWWVSNTLIYINTTAPPCISTKPKKNVEKFHFFAEGYILAKQIDFLWYWYCE